jgi:hypothetical protein
MAPCNNNFYQQQQPGNTGRMQSAIGNDTREAPIPTQHGSSENYMKNIMQADKQNPHGAFISKREADSHEQEAIHEIAAQSIKCASLNLCNAYSSLSCIHTLLLGNAVHNTCNYIDCILCHTNNNNKNTCISYNATQTVCF